MSRGQIARRIPLLARQIARCYQGGPLTVVAVMTGSLMFLADLVRGLDLPLRVLLVPVRSYRGGAVTPSKLKMGPVGGDLAGRHVLVIDDVLDGGATLSKLLGRIRRRRPASLRSCVLLRKTKPQAPAQRVRPDFVGFEAPDRFVVGYGLDYDDLYRNLPDVRELVWAKRR